MTEIGLQRLPPELWLEILRHAEPEQLKAVSLVSRSLHRLSLLCPFLILRIDRSPARTDHAEQLLTDQSQSHLLTAIGNVDIRRHSLAESIFSDGASRWLENEHNTSRDPTTFLQMTQLCFEKIAAGGLPNLHTLTLTNIAFDSRNLSLILAVRTLRSLTMSQCSSQGAMFQLPTSHIQSFTVSDFKNALGCWRLEDLVSHCSPLLRFFSISNKDFRALDAELGKKLTRLASLTLPRIPRDSLEEIDHFLRELGALEELILVSADLDDFPVHLLRCLRAITVPTSALLPTERYIQRVRITRSLAIDDFKAFQALKDALSSCSSYGLEELELVIQQPQPLLFKFFISPVAQHLRIFRFRVVSFKARMSDRTSAGRIIEAISRAGSGSAAAETSSYLRLPTFPRLEKVYIEYQSPPPSDSYPFTLGYVRRALIPAGPSLRSVEIMPSRKLKALHWGTFSWWKSEATGWHLHRY